MALAEEPPNAETPKAGDRAPGDAYLALDNVSLNYPVYNFESRSIRNLVMAVGSGGKLRQTSRKFAVVEALRDISVRIEHGDRLALVGLNGSGKSTLLKVMAGLITPSSGTVERRGKVITMFDLGLGMDEDATGYENIFLGGYYRGLSKKEITRYADEIAEFSELGEYLAMPIRIYSMGMRMRLAFSIGTVIVPDILLIDEVMGAGDASFTKKAQARIDQLLSDSKIVVFASHSDGLLSSICNKGLLLHKGQVLAQGELGKVLEEYHRLF